MDPRPNISASVLLVLIAGCASEADLPSGLTTQATPAEWVTASIVDFRVTDARGKSLGSFVLEFTREPAQPCIDGEWFRARPKASDLADLNAWWKDEALWPAYTIQGRLLNVELNGGRLCDSYFSVRAQIDPAGGQ